MSYSGPLHEDFLGETTDWIAEWNLAPVLAREQGLRQEFELGDDGSSGIPSSSPKTGAKKDGSATTVVRGAVSAPSEATVQETYATLMPHTANRLPPPSAATCEICYAVVPDMLDHMFAAHAEEQLYACDFDGCTRRFAQLRELSNHRRIHAVDPELPYRCDVCLRFRARTAEEIAAHVTQTHDRMNHKYVCEHPGCGLSFAHRAGYSQHKWAHLS